MLGRGRRMRRRGLIAGAAIASHRQNQYQQEAQYDQQAAYQQGQADAQQAAAPPPAAPPPAADPMATVYTELKQLGQLHSSGVLNDQEFAAQVQKLLDSQA